MYIYIDPPLFFTPAGLGTKQYNQSYLIKGRSKCFIVS